MFRVVIGQKSKMGTKRSSTVKSALSVGRGILELKISQAKNLVAADSNGKCLLQESL